MPKNPRISRTTRLRCLEKYNWGVHTINCLTEAVKNLSLLRSHSEGVGNTAKQIGIASGEAGDVWCIKSPRSWKQIANRNLRSVTWPYSPTSAILRPSPRCNKRFKTKSTREMTALLNPTAKTGLQIDFIPHRRPTQTETSTDTSHNSRQNATLTTAKIATRKR